jgi:replicative DNA helicase
MEQPHNLEAEEALLACCLLDNVSYDSISTIVNADDFYSNANKIIFKGIAKLCSSGEEFSELELDELLKREGTDREAGGLSTIMHLQGQASSSTQIVSHAKIVKEKSKLRQIIRTSRIAIEAATENQDPDVIIADIERSVTATLDNGSADDPSIRSAAESLREDFKKMAEGTYSTFALPTRIKQLDDKLSAGGIANGEVMVVAAPTSCGKTCIALNVALQNGVTHNKPGLYFSFEMQAKSLAKRMIQTCSAVNLNQFQEGVLSPEKQKRVWDATERVENAPIFTEHYVRNIDELRSRARMYKRKHNIEWIVIDYLQLVPWNTKLKKHDGIAEVSHQIKLMAMELNLPVILLAQVNREGAKRETGITLYDLKDSGDIENDADIILLLWPNGSDTKEATVHNDPVHGTHISIKYNIAKQREGERDQYGKFVFQNNIGRFS